MFTREIAHPQPREVMDHGWSHGRLPVPPNGEWDEFAKFWEDLPQDAYVKRIHRTSRHRRLGRLLARGGQAGGLRAEVLPSAGFFQSAAVNSVYGGQARTFAPIAPETYHSGYFTTTLGRDLTMVREMAGNDPDWLITIHLIRVSATADTSSAPAPEGRHSDGHEFVIMHLVGRNNCTGGHSRVFGKDAVRPVLERTLQLPMETVVIDDRAMEHEVTPISPVGAATAVRDMLIIDFDRPDAGAVVDGTYESIDLNPAR
jgi:hypothetical protein